MFLHEASQLCLPGPQGPVAAAVDGHGTRLPGPVAAHLTAEPKGPGLGLQHQLQGGLGKVMDSGHFFGGENDMKL